jgi:hypothetical protein
MIEDATTSSGEPNQTTRVFNVQAKTIVDRFGNDVVDSQGNKIWFPVAFDLAAAIAFGKSLASKSTVATALDLRRDVKEGGPWDSWSTHLINYDPTQPLFAQWPIQPMPSF